jgi:hypothetical protein
LSNGDTWGLLDAAFSDGDSSHSEVGARPLLLEAIVTINAIVETASVIGASAAADFFVLSLGVLIVFPLVDLVC